MNKEKIKSVYKPRTAIFILAFFILITITGIFSSMGGTGGSELDSFIFAAFEVAPFVILAILAYLTEDKIPALRWITYIWLILLLGLMALATLGIGIISVVPPDVMIDENPDFGTGAAYLVQICLMMLGTFFAVLISLVGLSRRFRVFAARYIPIDPDSFVHKIALVTVTSAILIPLIPLLVTGQAPFLSPGFLEMVAASGDSVAESIRFDAYTLLWTIGGSFLIVGLFIRRDFDETLKRLAFVRPTAKQVSGALTLAVILVGVFTIIDMAIHSVWVFLGWNETDAESINMLFSSALTPAGAIVAAVCAGVGEELSVRGVLQPRFGIIIPSLLFASLHAFQYNFDGLLSVFIAGIVFAYIRRYSNTSTSAITHGTYDLILFCLIMVGVGV